MQEVSDAIFVFIKPNVANFSNEQSQGLVNEVKAHTVILFRYASPARVYRTECQLSAIPTLRDYFTKLSSSVLQVVIYNAKGIITKLLRS